MGRRARMIKSAAGPDGSFPVGSKVQGDRAQAYVDAGAAVWLEEPQPAAQEQERPEPEPEHTVETAEAPEPEEKAEVPPVPKRRNAKKKRSRK